MITIGVHFEGEQDLLDLRRYIAAGPFVRVEGELAQLAEDAVNLMIQTIEDYRKNPARPGVSKLQNSIDYTELLNDPGTHLIIGIANLDKMKIEAPYFELIDAGGTYVTKKTHVVPTDYFSYAGSGFVTFKEGSTHVIEGIGYFSKAEIYIRTNLDKIVNEIIADYTNKMETPKNKYGKTFVGAWGKNVRFGAPGTGANMGGAR